MNRTIPSGAWDVKLSKEKRRRDVIFLRQNALRVGHVTHEEWNMPVVHYANHPDQYVIYRQ